MSNMFIVRGVPGSGKNTFAETLGVKVVSADDYFMDNGEYKFDASKLKAAHRYCFGKVKSLVEAGQDVAVANTFTRQWGMQNYFDLAEEFGYMVFSLIVENRHGGENVHNVPEDAIQNMKSRFEVKL